ncbi:MAG: hypothetical protein KGN02_10380 [bacterium]|nr:hypothetical protein [bacterium]
MAMVQPQVERARPRIANPRSARSATETRIVKNNRARYASLLRVGAVLTLLLGGLLGYVMLTSNVTSLSYAVGKAQAQRAALQEETARLDDRIAMLESDERLARIAAKLDMHQPEQFSLVRLDNAPHVANGNFPVLNSIAGWFGGGAPHPHTR